MITEHCESYMNASTQLAKKESCEKIIHMVRGRFLRFDVLNKGWVEITEEAARVKVAQAFQYRQRRLNQKDSSSAVWSVDDPQKKDRKRKLHSASSAAPDHNNETIYPSMRYQQPSVSEDNTVSIDEIRWVLGMQTSLPQHQPSMQQPSNIIESFSNVNRNIDDVAIGMPASMRMLPSEQYLQQLTQPAPDFTDFMERFRRNSMLSATNVDDCDSAARFLMQSHFSDHSQQGYILPENHVRPPQAVQHLERLNWQQGQAFGSPVNLYFPNNVASVGYVSQATIEESLNQPIQTQGATHSSNIMNLSRNNIDEFGTIVATSDQMRIRDRAIFDSSYPIAVSELPGGWHNAAQAESQKQHPPNNTVLYTNPPYHHELSLDPLPLNDSEIVQSYDKILDDRKYDRKEP
jgi:hypothetical protein